ncbi:MAG: hypothetical protein ACFFCQ_03470 [Promethearchaeota archaeon]
MSSNQNITAILSKMMDTISELEGVILSKAGNIIAAKTIYESIDDPGAARQAAEIVKASQSLSKIIEKGQLKEATLAYDKGFAIVVEQDGIILTGIAGSDARSQLGLLKINLAKSLGIVKKFV